MNLQQLQAELNESINDATLLRESRLGERNKALALVALIQRIAPSQRHQPGFSLLHHQARALQQQLEAVNQQLYQSVRSRIQSGIYRGAALQQLCRQYTEDPSTAPGMLYFGYDGLDDLISGALSVDSTPQPTQALEPEMVHYERTPMRAILAMVQRIHFAPESVFYDLGSGLGEVAIFVHLLTGVPSKGVEFDGRFCQQAQQTAQQFGLTDVTFIHADARALTYSDGTIFFMFTPFYGAIMQTVLMRLEQHARQRPITICTYGPCTLAVAKQSWLHSPDGSGDHEFKLAVFHSKQP